MRDEIDEEPVVAEPRRLPPLLRYLLLPLRFQRNARLYLAGSLLMGLGHGAVWVHMNLYYRSLGLGEAEIGRILSAGSLGTVLVALPAAVWVDRFPAQRVFVASAIGFALALAAQLLTSHPLLLAIEVMVARALFTVHWVAAAPFFMRNASARERLDLFSFAHAMETLATVVSAALVGVLIDGFARATGSELTGIRYALFIPAAAALLATWPFARIQSPAAGGPARRMADYLTARNWPLIGRLTLPAFLVGLGAGLTIPFLNLYFRDRFGETPRAIGTYFAVAQLITMLGFLAGPVLARRIGVVRTVVVTELGSIPFFFLLAVSQDLTWALIAFWMRAALMNMNHPVSTAFSMSMVRPEEQATTNSVRELCWNIAWMMSTQLGGLLIETHGYALPMFVTMGLYLSAAALFYRFFRAARPLKDEAAPREPEPGF